MDNSCLELHFPAVKGRAVTCSFNGGDLSSDAGLLLVREADRKLGLVPAMSACLKDRRQVSKVDHSLLEMLRERVYAIAVGYEDANDLDTLRHDPLLKIACERRPRTGAPLASQPTFSRLENSLSTKDLVRMGRALAELVVDQLPADTQRVVLDVDATDDPCYGQQEFQFFNRYYHNNCYLPLHLYVTGPDKKQRLLASLLRPGNAGPQLGLFGLVRGACKLLRKRFPQVQIVLRADAAFGNASVITFCKRQRLRYVFALRSNSYLSEMSWSVQIWAAIRHGKHGLGGWTGEECAEYDELNYRAATWPQTQRVIFKASVQGHEVHARTLVTNLAGRAEDVYNYYTERGDLENRLKELKLDLRSGRTSSHRFWANQTRLLLHTAACVLLQMLQEAAGGTEWVRAQAGTLRVRLLKVAARVVESCRRIWIHLPTAYPNQDVWQHLHCRLCGPDT